MARTATIAWGGFSGRVDLARAVLLDARGGEVWVPPAGAAWRVLDRTPVSVRLAGVDGAGRRTVVRFEADGDGVLVEIAGGVPRRFRSEVRCGDVPVQD